jgi:hypothetical protein
MTSTLFQVMGRIQSYVVPSDIGISAVASGGSTTTLVDSTNLAGGASRGDNLFEFLWLAIFQATALNMRRVIEGGDVASTGTLTFAPALSTAVTSSHSYQVWTIDPALVVRAIDVALRRMEYVERIPLTVVTDQQLYSLATDAAWVERPSQLLGLEWQDTATTPAQVPLGVQSWRLTRDRGVYTLNLGRAFTLGQDTVTLVTLRSYWSLDGTPQSGGATQGTVLASWTTTAPLEWLAAEAAVELLEKPVTARMVAARQGEFEQALREARGIVKEYRADWQPDVPRRMFARTARHYDPVGVWW